MNGRIASLAVFASFLLFVVCFCYSANVGSSGHVETQGDLSGYVATNDAAYLAAITNEIGGDGITSTGTGRVRTNAVDNTVFRTNDSGWLYLVGQTSGYDQAALGNILATNSTALNGQAAAYYLNWANITNMQDVRTIEVQDPTNSIPYYVANPFNVIGTGSSVWLQSHGVTGNVCVVTQAQTAARYSYGVLHTNIALTATGTNLTITGASLAATDRLGFYTYGLSIFQVTNQVRADFTFTKP